MVSRYIRQMRLLWLKYKHKQLFMGHNVTIDSKTKINVFQHKCTISDNVVLRSTSKGYHAGMPFGTTIFIDVPKASVFIGKNCRLNGVYIHAQSSITIGKNCVIAAGVNIIDSNGHIIKKKNRTVGRDTPQSINIGENVWIGLNSIILKGTEIGNNSVVSAGSVVKGVFPENSIISGNPAKVIDYIKIKNENSDT